VDEKGGYYTGKINAQRKIELYDLENNYQTETIKGEAVEI
jgi:hypothetical protein